MSFILLVLNPVANQMTISLPSGRLVMILPWGAPSVPKVMSFEYRLLLINSATFFFKSFCAIIDLLGCRGTHFLIADIYPADNGVSIRNPPHDIDRFKAERKDRHVFSINDHEIKGEMGADKTKNHGENKGTRLFFASGSKNDK
jgi:hypothetical protein